MKDLPYIKTIFIGPNPQDKKIFMVDYDNKGYRGGTDSFKTEVKLDKEKDDDIFESFKEQLYSFDFGDYPLFLRQENSIGDKRFFFDLLKAGFDHMRNIGQIGPPNFIFIKEDYLEDDRINKLVRDNVRNIFFYDEDNIIIGRRNDNRYVEPGLYLCYDNEGNYSIEPIGNRAKEQYLILKIKK